MTTRRFIGFRPKVPQGYIEGGYGNQPNEVQYEGVVFSDGTTILRWLTQYRSTSVWASFEEMEKVHGHPDYETRIEWLDLAHDSLCKESGGIDCRCFGDAIRATNTASAAQLGEGGSK